MKTREELSCCGCDCEECNIYRANVYGEELKPETIQRWQEDARKYWGIESLDPKLLNCRGCRDEAEDKFDGFKMCPIRGCCKNRGLVSCGLCPDFQLCQLHDVPEGRENLERIAAAE
ncbi:MAG TPA: DUF3795 domain-containing protein [Dehalococcoidia bacterium]|nr:DUF3795 domain-containing protein [Dehalococcoidia bacterium]